MKKYILIILSIILSSTLLGQDILGGQNIEGTLRVELEDNSNLGLYRYTNGSWVQQWFSGDWSGFKLYVGSQGSDDDLNFASGFFQGNDYSLDRTSSSWDDIDLNKIDDSKYDFVICSNVLGGCMGSSGPSSINPKTNRVFGMNFPVITIGDPESSGVSVTFIVIGKVCSTHPEPFVTLAKTTSPSDGLPLI